MTNNQAKFFYFPAWNAAAAAHDWRMAKGKLVGKHQEKHGPEDTTDLYHMVWQAAEIIALRHSRAVRPEDLRHGCHLVALGKDKSSTDFTNSELDRVVTLFRVLTDPDDLDAIIAWSNPEVAERQRMVLWVKNKCVPAYAHKLCRELFGTDDYATLEPKSLHELVATLKQRPRAWVKSPPPSAPMSARMSANECAPAAVPQKPINLDKERQARMDREADEAAAELAGKADTEGNPW